MTGIETIDAYPSEPKMEKEKHFSKVAVDFRFL